MSKRIGGKFAGAALSVAVLGGCTTATESNPTPLTLEQVKPQDTPDERFIDTGRYITHIITCIANDERSEMTNISRHVLDNLAETLEPTEKRGVQPVQVRIQRGAGPAYEEGSWTALYRVPPTPAGRPLYAVQARGDVPLGNTFWENADSTDLNLEQADAGATEVIPEAIGMASPTMDTSVGKRNDRYYHIQPPRSTPLNEQELDAFLAQARDTADELLELSGVHPAVCNPD